MWHLRRNNAVRSLQSWIILHVKAEGEVFDTTLPPAGVGTEGSSTPRYKEAQKLSDKLGARLVEILTLDPNTDKLSERMSKLCKLKEDGPWSKLWLKLGPDLDEHMGKELSTLKTLARDTSQADMSPDNACAKALEKQFADKREETMSIAESLVRLKVAQQKGSLERTFTTE